MSVLVGTIELPGISLWKMGVQSDRNRKPPTSS